MSSNTEQTASSQNSETSGIVYNEELKGAVKVNTVSTKGDESMASVLKGFQDDYQDNTEYLRDIKRSTLIRYDVLKMERLKRKDKSNTTMDEFSELCKRECSYLFTNYPMIFNKMLKDVLDLRLLFVALDTLKKIEEGAIDQEEGSILMGKLFAEMYLDSSKREGASRDAAVADTQEAPVEGKAISWKQYKLRQR